MYMYLFLKMDSKIKKSIQFLNTKKLSKNPNKNIREFILTVHV